MVFTRICDLMSGTASDDLILVRDLKKEELRRYLFEFQINDGGHEYTEHGLVEALDRSSADRSAKEKVEGFLPFMTYDESSHVYISQKTDESRALRYRGIVAEGDGNIAEYLIREASWSLYKIPEGDKSLKGDIDGKS